MIYNKKKFTTRALATFIGLFLIAQPISAALFDVSLFSTFKQSVNTKFHNWKKGCFSPFF